MKQALKLFIFFHSLILLLQNSLGAKVSPKATVLLISFDGFRWDYMDKTETPHFDSIVTTGVKAKYVKNAFVTKTFPNHFTIVTGLYEESHGIVANTMYDPEFKSWFYLNNTEPRWWNGGEPLWITNQNSGGTSGTVFWPGSNVKIRGQYPTYYMKYDYHFPYKDRVDKIIDLLSKKNPPTFLALYFEEPDHSCHMYGPDSKEVIQAIHTADNITGYLINQLKAKEMYDKINIIITSDHGMTEISANKTVYLQDYVQSDWYTPILGGGWDSFISIKPKDGYKDKIYDRLKNVPNIKVYKKEDIPAEYHYTNNRRIMPILVVGDEGWNVALSRKIEIHNKGNHGYSNKYESMHPFFIAHGPVFKRGYLSDPFKNVDIYPLICHILGIKPAPNNGSLADVQQLLHNKVQTGSNFVLLIVLVIIAVFVVVIMGYGIISFCVDHHCKMSRYGHIYDLGPELTDFS